MFVRPSHPIGCHAIDRNGVIVRMNQTELDWLGYRPDEVVGRMRLVQLLTDEGRALFARAFPQFVRGEPFRNELELVRRDGIPLPVMLNAIPLLDAAGEFVMSISTVFRTTYRRKLGKAAGICIC